MTRRFSNSTAAASSTRATPRRAAAMREISWRSRKASLACRICGAAARVLALDCSGLVQTSLQAAGFAAPRDTDMQQAELGGSVPVAGDLEGLKRGDLVFWKGHVGIMVDSVLMVHANAHHMMVAVEPLSEAAQRIARTGSQIIAIKRLEPQDMSSATA